MYQYSVSGTYQFGEKRIKFSTVVQADSWEQAIEIVKTQYTAVEVTSIKYMGESNVKGK